MQHQIDVGDEFCFFRRVVETHLHEAVFGADIEIGQEADAGFGGDTRFDEVEVVAGEDDSAPGELFCLPQAVRAGDVQAEEGLRFARAVFQVMGAGIEAVADGAQAAGDQVVLCRAYDAKGDVGLARVQVADLCIALQDEADVAVAAGEGGKVRHQQSFGDQRRRGDDDFSHFFALLARGAQQGVHADGDVLRLRVDACALFAEQVAAADAVKEAQAKCRFQPRDAARDGAVLHAERVSSGGKGLFFYEYGEMVQVVPVGHGVFVWRVDGRRLCMDYRRPAVFRILCASRTIYTARSFSTQEPNMNTLSLGQQIFADLSAGNLEAVLQRCADDVRFTAVRAEPCAAVPVYGEYRGKDGVRQFFQNLGAAVEFGEFRLDGTAAGADVVMMHGYLRHTVRATGKAFASDWALAMQFSSGLMSHYRFYEDSAALQQAMEAS